MDVTTNSGQQRRILASMSLALMLVIATVTAVNLALPELATDLSATNTQITWIADAYTVALAALVLPFGALGDRYGRRRILVRGMLVFGIAAALASVQSTASGVIWCRAGMGVGAAMIMPGTLATITASFPENQRSRAVATWAGVAGAGAVVGLVSSGLLLEFFSWHSVFVFAVVLAVIGIVTAYVGAPETRGDQLPLDYVGAVLSAIGFGLIVLGIIEYGEIGLLQWRSLGAFVVGAVILGVWLWHQLRVDHPLLDVQVFRYPRFAAGTIAVTSQFLAQFGFIFVAMQYLQIILGYSPLRAAFAMVPLAIVVLPMSQAVPRILKRIPERIVLPLGILGLVAGLLVLSTMSADSGYVRFAIGLMVLGFGVAWTATPATTAITEGLPRSQQGIASAVNDATRELGAALGIAVMGATFTATYRDSITAFIDHIPADTIARIPTEVVDRIQQSPAAGMMIADRMGAPGAALRDAVTVGFMDGVQWSLRVVAAFMVVIAMVCGWLLHRARYSSRK